MSSPDANPRAAPTAVKRTLHGPVASVPPAFFRKPEAVRRAVTEWCDRQQQMPGEASGADVKTQMEEINR